VAVDATRRGVQGAEATGDAAKVAEAQANVQKAEAAAQQAREAAQKAELGRGSTGRTEPNNLRDSDPI
jgi:hypothetical protein